MEQKIGVAIIVMGLFSLSAGLVFAQTGDLGLLTSSDLSSSTVIGNIKLVGVLMIGISLAALGLKVAIRLIDDYRYWRLDEEDKKYFR